MESYIPDIPEKGYARFLLRLENCPECGRDMVVRPYRARDTFPCYYKLDFDAQVKAAGFCVRSGIQAGHRYICEDCARAGRAWFRCELCGEKKPTNKIKEQFGDPPDFLCTDCFESVSAMAWDDVTEKLYESHRYDFE